MTEVTEVVKQHVTQALGELAGQFRVHVRPCHFETSVLADATAAVTIRAAGPCVDLNAAHRALAGMPGLVYLTQQKYELWAYVNAGASA